METSKILPGAGQEAQAAGERTSERASERASTAGGWAHEQRAGERASKQRSSIRGGLEQQALNVVPIIDCEGRCFAVVYKQTGERATFKQLYTFEGRYLYEYKVTFCTSVMK